MHNGHFGVPVVGILPNGHFQINDYFTAESIKTNILGTSAGPTHRQMEETIRGVIEATVIRENNPRCQLNVTIQPFNTNFCLTPLINCTILGPLLIRTGRTGPPGHWTVRLLSGRPIW